VDISVKSGEVACSAKGEREPDVILGNREMPADSAYATGEAFASLARDIRNPIQAIWLALAVIQKRAVQQDETLAQAIRIIREESEQLNKVVQENLEFARLTVRETRGI
jgi:signal transduction histidine kinase